MTSLLQTALADYGLSETQGPADTPEIMAMARELGIEFAHDETSWCGLAMAAWVKRSGGQPPKGFLAARSWLDWGTPVSEPATGDVVVFWRSDPGAWEGHVGIFVARRFKLVHVLGGNQSNAVCVAPYLTARVLGFRRA